MTIAQLLKNLQVPDHPVDVVLDTDAYNEIDDQFAIAYLLRSEKLKVKGLCAAPFLNSKSVSPADGMEKSYKEIFKIVRLAGRSDQDEVIFRGSDRYLPDESTPVPSDSATFMVELSKQYSAENPLYIVAIGAITNVASALLMDPEMKDRVVLVWLGGTGWHMPRNEEFNLTQDIAAARIIFGCGAPLVQLPCAGVVDSFTVSKYELEYWLQDKTPLSDYLARNTIAEAESYASGKPWTRVIWDVTAIAWLLNDQGRFMDCEIRHSPIPEYDDHYAMDNTRHFMCYVNKIHRDQLMEDLIQTILK